MYSWGCGHISPREGLTGYLHYLSYLKCLEVGLSPLKHDVDTLQNKLERHLGKCRHVCIPPWVQESDEKKKDLRTESLPAGGRSQAGLGAAASQPSAALLGQIPETLSGKIFIIDI